MWYAIPMLSDHQFSDSKDFKYPQGYRKSYPNQGNMGAARHPADIMSDGNADAPDTLLDSARGGGVDGDGYDDQFPTTNPHVLEPLPEGFLEGKTGERYKVSGPSNSFDNMMGYPMESLDRFPTSYDEGGDMGDGGDGGDGGA